MKNMVTKKQNIDLGIVLTLVLLVSGLIFNVHLLFRIAVGTLLIAALLPVAYTPLSWVWFRFSTVVERIFSTIILSLIFYLVVTPIGLFRRFFAKDTMHLHDFGKEKKSVFIEKKKSYDKNDIEHQF